MQTRETLAITQQSFPHPRNAPQVAPKSVCTQTNKQEIQTRSSMTASIVSTSLSTSLLSRIFSTLEALITLPLPVSLRSATPPLQKNCETPNSSSPFATRSASSSASSPPPRPPSPPSS